jgi:hypothetical protein
MAAYVAPDADYIRVSELCSRLSTLVGIQRAEELVEESIRACHLPKKSRYSLPEFKALCDQLRTAGGMLAMMVRAVAGELIISEQSDKR